MVLWKLWKKSCGAKTITRDSDPLDNSWRAKGKNRTETLTANRISQ